MDYWRFCIEFTRTKGSHWDFLEWFNGMKTDLMSICSLNPSIEYQNKI